MTKLNLLGAQRVKALTEILERKYSDKISELDNLRISEEGAVELFSKEIGSEDLLEKIREHEAELKGLEREALSKLGLEIHVRVRTDYWSSPKLVGDRIREIETGSSGEAKKRLKRDLEDKKSQLWLVETLEG